MINLDFKEKRRNYQFKKYLERRTRRRGQQQQHDSLTLILLQAQSITNCKIYLS